MGNKILKGIQGSIEATHGPEVLASASSFTGLYDATAIQGMEQPALVASTNGVGAKTRIAVEMSQARGLGLDVVNHCVNDILVQGSKPLFFLDYVAMGQLDETLVIEVVEGMAEACQAVGCALLGGESLEVPGVFKAGELDIVGTVVGVVNRPSIIDGEEIAVGDRVLGLASSGLHSTGYVLAEKALKDKDLNEVYPSLGQSLGEALLQPHLCYLKAVERLRASFVPLKGLLHIAGGGLLKAPPKIVSDELSIEINQQNWEVPPLFQLIQEAGELTTTEMRQTFNMGVGFMVVVPKEEYQWALGVLEQAGIKAFEVGQIISRDEGDDAVQFVKEVSGTKN